MKRQIVNIDEEKCDGCGLCASGCHEGAIQMINGKAVLINELLCDGLGACIGECPVDAIEITIREAELYDEIKVMESLVPKGFDVVFAHLKHLQDYKEEKWLEQGRAFLFDNEENIDFDISSLLVKLEANIVFSGIKNDCASGSCSGSFERTAPVALGKEVSNSVQNSELSNWPVQFHLINPQSSVFNNANLLLSADCVAHSIGDFHAVHLKGKKLAIACPKFDSNLESYIEKIQIMIDFSGLNSIHVMMMEVPCCHSVLSLVKRALAGSSRSVPVTVSVVSAAGEILSEQKVN